MVTWLLVFIAYGQEIPKMGNFDELICDLDFWVIDICTEFWVLANYRTDFQDFSIKVEVIIQLQI